MTGTRRATTVSRRARSAPPPDGGGVKSLPIGADNGHLDIRHHVSAKLADRRRRLFRNGRGMLGKNMLNLIVQATEQSVDDQSVLNIPGSSDLSGEEVGRHRSLVLGMLCIRGEQYAEVGSHNSLGAAQNR